MTFLARRYLIALAAWIAILISVDFLVFVLERQSAGSGAFGVEVLGRLGIAALILGPPALIVGFWYWWRGGGARAA